eukprot:scaffold285_cov330-Pavlova_lutheri.AAC.4
MSSVGGTFTAGRATLGTHPGSWALGLGGAGFCTSANRMLGSILPACLRLRLSISSTSYAASTCIFGSHAEACASMTHASQADARATFACTRFGSRDRRCFSVGMVRVSSARDGPFLFLTFILASRSSPACCSILFLAPTACSKVAPCPSPSTVLASSKVMGSKGAPPGSPLAWILVVFDPRLRSHRWYEPTCCARTHRVVMVHRSGRDQAHVRPTDPGPVSLDPTRVPQRISVPPSRTVGRGGWSRLPRGGWVGTTLAWWKRTDGGEGKGPVLPPLAGGVYPTQPNPSNPTSPTQLLQPNHARRDKPMGCCFSSAKEVVEEEDYEEKREKVREQELKKRTRTNANESEGKEEEEEEEEEKHRLTDARYGRGKRNIDACSGSEQGKRVRKERNQQPKNRSQAQERKDGQTQPQRSSQRRTGTAVEDRLRLRGNETKDARRLHVHQGRRNHARKRCPRGSATPSPEPHRTGRRRRRFSRQFERQRMT